MRVAIIILGIVGLLVLAFKWDSMPTDPNSIPKEGIIHSQSNYHQPNRDTENPLCPKCKDNKEIVATHSHENFLFCKKHGDVVVNL